MTDEVAQSEDEEVNPENPAGRFDEPDAHVSFPVVGIGASAGGLEAFRQLLAALPADTGMAFVLVQHLDPRHESRLTDLLGRATPMSVTEATDGVAVAGEQRLRHPA